MDRHQPAVAVVEDVERVGAPPLVERRDRRGRADGWPRSRAPAPAAPRVDPRRLARGDLHRDEPAEARSDQPTGPGASRSIASLHLRHHPRDRQVGKSGWLKSGVTSSTPHAAASPEERRLGRLRRRGKAVEIEQLHGSEPGLAAGPAPARDRLLAVGAVVVGQLFALRDVAGGADPDRLPDDLRVAVRLAGVIDEARDVAADRGITDVQAIQLEAPDVARSSGIGSRA